MKKLTVLLLIITLICPAMGLEVDVNEIKTKKVDFINYKGKNKKIDPLKEIYAIGTRLANGAIKRGPNSIFRYHMKYSIYRAIGKEEPKKYSADIFSIDREASVDHIKNVRRIISAYLMRIYKYSKKEADSLALFTIYYNAIHRGDINYFSKRYKTIILKKIKKSNAGIARKYSDWPGNTKILIPLTDEDVRNRIVDPFAIADKETRRTARKDKTVIPERKQILELKKEKAEEEKKNLENEKNKIKEEEKKLREIKKETRKEEKRIAKEKTEISEKRKEIQKEKARIKDIKEPGKRKSAEKKIAEKERKLESKEDKIIKDEEAVKLKKEETSEKEDSLDKTKKDAADKEQKLAEKQKDIEEDRREIRDDEIAKDIEKEPSKAKRELKEKEQELKIKEKELDRREDKIKETAKEETIYANMFYYLKIKEYLEGGHYNNEMCMIDPATRKILFKSPEQNICGRRYDIFSEGIIVITHRGSHTSGHRLTLLDRKTLKPTGNGSDNIFWRSFVEIRGNSIFAILYDNGKHYLGRFDTELKLTAKSDNEINENTFITFYEKYIYINRKDRQIMVLDKDTLKQIDIIKP